MMMIAMTMMMMMVNDDDDDDDGDADVGDDDAMRHHGSRRWFACTHANKYKQDRMQSNNGVQYKQKPNNTEQSTSI